MKLISNMPHSLSHKTPPNVIEAKIPIAGKRPADATNAARVPENDESGTRRAHRLRMKAFLAATRSVA